MSLAIVRRIQTAVLAVKSAGIPLVRGVWGVYPTREGKWDHHWPGVDPLGALLLHEQPAPFFPTALHGDVAALLGVTVPWVLVFRHGYHEWTACDVYQYPPYRIGAWFALEYADDLVSTMEVS